MDNIQAIAETAAAIQNVFELASDYAIQVGSMDITVPKQRKSSS